MRLQLHHDDCFAAMERLDAGSVDLILTDLPYGTTANKWDTLLPLDQLWAAWKRVAKPGAAVALFSQQPFTTRLAASNLKNLRTEWIWEKPQGTGFLNAKVYPLKNHENILIFCERAPLYNPQMSEGKPYLANPGSSSRNYGKYVGRSARNPGTRFPRSVVKMPHERSLGVGHKGLHPTQKPVALCEYFIRTYTNEGDTILDCCMGSGTTGVAALQTGRSFIGIERETEYFAIARERMEAVHGDRLAA